MSTQTRTLAVHNPIRWFMSGVATTLIAAAIASGLALAILLPSTKPGDVAAPPAAGSFLEEGYRLQRADEIGAGRASVAAPWLSGLNEHRKGEIGAGGARDAGFGGSGLTEQRKGEISGGG